MTSTSLPHATALEVIEGVDLTGRRALVTGASSGIGYETALALATAGAEVTLAVRNASAGADAAGRILEATGRRADVLPLDLTDRATIQTLADNWKGPLHILVNNAGIMAVPERTLTSEGRELQFATNHLGPAELTLRLHDALAAAGDARVVMVASSAHLMAPVDFDDIDFESRSYDGWAAYAQSKTAAILFATALAERWAADAIAVNSLHPGGIMTNLQRHLDKDSLAFVGALDAAGERLDVPPGWKTPQQGAATTVLLAASPALAGVTGRYFEDLKPAAVTSKPTVGGGGVAAWAVDPTAAQRLYTLTAEAVGVI